MNPALHHKLDVRKKEERLEEDNRKKRSSEIKQARTDRTQGQSLASSRPTPVQSVQWLFGMKQHSLHKQSGGQTSANGVG